jgi:Leucine-rich repeat (LRR) protein
MSTISFLDVLSRDLLQLVLFFVTSSEHSRYTYPRPYRVWFLAAVCKRLRSFLREIQPERLPLEVDTRHVRSIERVAYNINAALKLFAIKRLELDLTCDPTMVYSMRAQSIIGKMLRWCTHLTDLTLRTSLCAGLLGTLSTTAHLSRLTRLSLLFSRLDEQDTMTAFVGFCERLSNLTSLSVWNVSFMDGSLLALALQQLAKLQHVYLAEIEMDVTTFRDMVVYGLNCHTTLTDLHVGFADDEMKIAMRQDQDTAEPVIEEALEALSHFTRLRLLSLKNIETLHKTPSLFTSLTKLTGLTEIRLPGCEVGDAAVPWLAAVLAQCTALRVLDLSYNQIDVAGMASLVAVLPECTHLRNLNLHNNNAREVPAVMQAAISRCNTVVCYDYSDSEDDDDASEDDLNSDDDM